VEYAAPATAEVCYDFADRVRSYELVAEVCGLKPHPHGMHNSAPGER
jgi:hypothetical protein